LYTVQGQRHTPLAFAIGARQGRLAILAGVAILALVAGLFLLDVPSLLGGSSDDDTASRSDSAACPAVTDGAKAPLAGLLTVGRPADSSTLDLAGWSINVTWAELQPAAFGPISRPNAIDSAVAEAKRRSAGAECPMGIKLRVLTGTSSPEWAKAVGGAPVPMTLESEAKTGTVPRFWTAEFGRAYADLQTKLAQQYDGVGEVREVVVSRCATFYAEPLLRQLGEGANQAALQRAGWTEDLDKECLRDQLDAHLPWQRTPSSLALNPYQQVYPSGEVIGDMGVPMDAAEQCRQALGDRCILANNSIRWPPFQGRYRRLYDMMKTLGPPLEFQAAAPKRIGDEVETLKWAIELGAGSIEISPILAEREGAALAGAIADWEPIPPPAT
jgi:hypothetical protein